MYMKLFLESENESAPQTPSDLDFDSVPDTGTSCDEIEAMIQVMQGHTISSKVKKDAVQAYKKCRIHICMMSCWIESRAQKSGLKRRCLQKNRQSQSKMLMILKTLI